MNGTDQAKCKTCGGSPGHHRPSVLDPEGIGDPGHKMESPLPMGNSEIIETSTTIAPGQTAIELPKDIESILYLYLDGAWIREIRGHWLYVDRPNSEKSSATLTLQYYPKIKT